MAAPGLTTLTSYGAAGPVAIRELRAADAPACTVFFQRLDGQDIRMRFASPHGSIQYFLPSPPNEGVAFAAVDAERAILGVVNLAYVSSDAAEIAVIVRSDRKRRGIGRALMAHAIDWAEGNGLSHIVGYVLAENKAMRALAQVMKFQTVRWDASFLEIRRKVPVETT